MQFCISIWLGSDSITFSHILRASEYLDSFTNKIPINYKLINLLTSSFKCYLVLATKMFQHFKVIHQIYTISSIQSLILREIYTFLLISQITITVKFNYFIKLLNSSIVFLLFQINYPFLKLPLNIEGIILCIFIQYFHGFI